MSGDGVARVRLDPESGERFTSLRRPLGISSIGMNLIVLAPGERGRIHAHERQEEVYLVWDGTLNLLVDGAEHELTRGDVVSVSPATRRQLVNRGPGPCVLVALGGEPGAHVGRDGLAWERWDDGRPGRAPQDLPLPDDLPASERRG